MAKIFDFVKANKPQQSAFNLSHEVKLTGNMGDLIPFFAQEVYPTDKFKVDSEMLIRLAPMTAPVMHRINAYTHYFFVPYRLIFDKWQDFITGGEDGMDNTVPPFIYMDSSSTTERQRLLKAGTLADYLGFPSLPDDYDLNEFPAFQVSALPFRAYQLIYNEFYRDQNLQDKVPLTKNSGQVSSTELDEIMKLRKRGWEKDYFTSCLPFAQKGEPVQIPIAGSAPVMMRSGNEPTPNLKTQSGASASVGNLTSLSGKLRDNTGNTLKIDPNGSMYADMSQVSGVYVNDLREAIQVQRFLERNARSGTRYIEFILSHFGKRTPDFRLQRPEYLGGGKSPIVISEVLQTSSSDMTTPQGNMAGHGFGVGNTNSFTREFDEHGIVIGILSVLPTTAYQQGLPRQFTRFDKFDYLFPEFVHLGEQEVLNKELYFDFYSSTQNNNGTFGYQQRYGELRYIPSSVHGNFKNNLGYWHMGRKFASQPQLTEEFIESDPTHDIFAVTDPEEHKLFIQIYNNVSAVRPLPLMAEPGFMDH